jgi:transcriptional regulator with XRE-family HTH domain
VNSREADFGTFVANRRGDQGVSADKLAREVGVDPSAIEQWEHGAGRPSDAQLARLARALEIPMAELFELAGRPTPDAGSPGFTP